MEQKGDLSAFQRGMVVGARQVGLSIKETALLLGFSRTTVSRVCRECFENDQISCDRQVGGRKGLVDDRGQKRMAKLIQSNRKATIAQLTARYNQGVQKCISERTTRRLLKQMGYSKQKTPTASKGQPGDDPASKDQETAATVPEEAPELKETPAACPQDDSEATL